MKLGGKVAVVTGTGSGIGKSIAESFAREGAAVVAATRRATNGQPAVDEIVRRGGNAIFVECDVSVEESVRQLFAKAVKEFEKVDILVNNAGVNFAKPFEETSIADWDRVLNTDLRGAFLCTREAAQDMLRHGGGSIINITSVHTLAGLPGAAPYDAAKWAIVGMTKALAVEYASRGIRVNALSPGLINTQIWDDIMNAAPSAEECLSYWKANIPMGRVGTCNEIAAVAVFLASAEASYITGSNIVVDGGMTSQLISRAPYESASLPGGVR